MTTKESLIRQLLDDYEAELRGLSLAELKAHHAMQRRAASADPAKLAALAEALGKLGEA